MKDELTINVQSEQVPPHNAKHLLSAGFRSIREQKRFAKLLTYAVIYQQGGEWDEAVITETRNYCEIQVRRLGFPDGWGKCGSYEELKRWFFLTKSSNSR